MTVQNTIKRRGRPAKPTLEKELADLKKENARLRETHLSLFENFTVVCQEKSDFEHQIIGYKAVISYLEAQFGLKSTQ
jgi:hypothetical protein